MHTRKHSCTDAHTNSQSRRLIRLWLFLKQHHCFQEGFSACCLQSGLRLSCCPTLTMHLTGCTFITRSDFFTSITMCTALTSGFSMLVSFKSAFLTQIQRLRKSFSLSFNFFNSFKVCDLLFSFLNFYQNLRKRTW